MANCRNQNNVDTLHLTPFTINYGHFRCQALTKCCRYGERETGDWQCHHITAILIHTEISQRAPSGHFHQSWGAIVYLVDIFISLRHTYSLLHPVFQGFRVLPKNYNRQCNVNLDCVCFVLLLVFAKCPIVPCRDNGNSSSNGGLKTSLQKA